LEVKDLKINNKIVTVASIGLAVSLVFGIVISRLQVETSKSDIVFETVEEALVATKEKR
jgi:high-affinity Fe2+/Pb2+ permease